MSGTQLDALSLVIDNSEAFHAAADSMPHIVWTAGADGSIDFVNRRWLEYTGRPLETFQDPGYHGIAHPKDWERTMQAWRRAVRSGKPFEADYRIRRGSDGVFRWFLARAVPVRDANGAVRMWIGTATDIDAQKRANENLNFIIEASSALSHAQSVQDVCDQFARLAVQRFADWCVVVLRDEKGQFHITSLQHRDAHKVREVWSYVDRYPVSRDQRFAAMLEAGKPVLVPLITDELLQQSAQDDEHLHILRSLDLHSAIVAPFKADGSLLGGIVMYSAESRRRFDQSDVEVLSILSERGASAIARQRALTEEQRLNRRLKFVAQAMEAIHESLDLTTTFGALTRLISSTFADFAVALRVESNGGVRVIAASHSDPHQDDLVKSLIGVRPLQPDAERGFIDYLRMHKPKVHEHLRPGMIERSTWPYLAREISGLVPRAAATIPLTSRGVTYGAIVTYSTDERKQFTKDEIEILAEVGRHASVAMENAEALERERRIAETLQDSLLPPSLPAIPGLRFDSIYLPSATDAQVGGDWYDSFVLDDGSIVFSVGDVTGRGTDAAVIMGKVRHLLAIAPSYESDPARILDTVEAVLARRYPDAIVTACLGIIDPERRTAHFANAGHPPPVLRRKHCVEELVAEGLPIGLRRRSEPASAVTVDLHDAKMIVLYTDGLVEATHDVLYGYQRLRDVAATDALLHAHSPARFIEESCLSERPDDDVAVMTIQFDSSMRWSFDAENAKAAQDARGQFVRYLRANAEKSSDISMAELVFGELVGNVVRHSAGSIEVDVDWSQPYPVLHVIDRGVAFSVPSTLPDNVLSESGRGLFIVSQLTRSLQVEHVPDYGNHVSAELPVRRKAK